MKAPEKIKILDVIYPVKYFESRSEVDLEGKGEFASQWDMNTDTIRIQKGERSWKSICQSLWTMALEIICVKLDINIPYEKNKESIIRRLAVGLNTVQFYMEDKEKGMPDEEEGKEIVIVKKVGNNRIINKFVKKEEGSEMGSE